MTEKARNFWVGTFVLTSGLVLGSLMVWFGEVPDWIISSEWSLRITGVHELSGVGEGSSVNLNGVEIGRVRTIGFVNAEQPDQGVVITAGIKHEFSVPTGATAHIYGATLGFGMGHIDIVPSPNVSAQPIPRKDAEIPGAMKSKIAELISRETIDAIEKTITRIGDLAAAATPVAKNLGDILEQRGISQVEAPDAAQSGVIANVSTVLERLDRFIANLNVMLGDENLQEDVKSAVGNLKGATEEIRQTIALWNTESRRIADQVNKGIDQTVQNLDRSFVNLNRFLENLDEAATSLATALRQVAEGHGTAGLLVRDERLYEAAVLAIERFGAVMANLEVFTEKIKDDGYIIVGQAPTGFFKKRFPVGGQASNESPSR
ncbi:MAG: MCE family protein [Planctomycetes bacterium]|nr:MCE family protein [Planctomycetota bacterium]